MRCQAFYASDRRQPRRLPITTEIKESCPSVLAEIIPAPIDTALMNIATRSSFVLSRRHLLGIEGLERDEIAGLLDLAEEFVDLNRQIEKKHTSLRGRTL